MLSGTGPLARSEPSQTCYARRTPEEPPFAPSQTHTSPSACKPYSRMWSTAAFRMLRLLQSQRAGRGRLCHCNPNPNPNPNSQPPPGSSSRAKTETTHAGFGCTQRQVLKLHRTVIRIAREKDDDTRADILAHARAEFAKHRAVDRKDVMRIEHLLRLAGRQLELLQDPSFSGIERR